MGPYSKTIDWKRVLREEAEEYRDWNPQHTIVIEESKDDEMGHIYIYRMGEPKENWYCHTYSLKTGPLEDYKFLVYWAMKENMFEKIKGIGK